MWRCAKEGGVGLSPSLPLCVCARAYSGREASETVALSVYCCRIK